MSIYINGWDREKVLQRLEEKNGFNKCVSTCGQCLYRLNNKACFVGAFIPDNYKELNYIVQTNDSAKHLLRIYPDLKKLMPMNSNNMDRLQRFHDDSEDLSKDFTEQFLIKLENTLKKD